MSSKTSSPPRSSTTGKKSGASRARTPDSAALAPITDTASPRLASLEPAAARWIATLIRVASAHPAMSHVLDVLERLSDRPYRTNLLILGEPGTGKGGLARALSHLVAPHGRTVRVDLGGYPEEAALSRLCGEEEQPGLAEEANEGTLLIEEAAELSPRVQNELLRILKTGRVIRRAAPGGSAQECRVRVSALALSDKDLRAEVAAGRFRHDLYYRLARIVLWLPPLRERLDDIAAAAVWMGNRILEQTGVPLTLRGPEDMRRANVEEQRRSIELTKGAIEALQQHSWPGNFRELEAVLERSLLLYRTDRRLGPDEVALALRETHG